VAKPGCFIWAAYSYPAHPENRLTELCAATLATSPKLCAALLAAAEFEVAPRAEAIEGLVTQRNVRGVGRPDITLTARDVHGRKVEVWFEHKLDDTPWQISQSSGDYRRWLDRQRHDARVIFVSPSRPPDLGAMHWITWHQYAHKIDQIGRDWARGPIWVDEAMRHDAAAEFRALRELLFYLESEDLGMARSITENDLDVFAKAGEVLSKLRELLEDACARVNVNGLKVGRTWVEPKYVWADFQPTRKSWLDGPTGAASVEVQISPVDDFGEPYLSAPVIVAGASLRDEAAFLRLQAHSAWRESARANGFILNHTAYPSLYRVRSLSEVVETGSTADEHAQAIASFAADALSTLLTLNPGRVPSLPKPPKRTGPV